MSRLSLKSERDYTAEEIKRLAQSLRQGEPVEIQLIEAHYPIVEKFTTFFGIVYPWRRDDIKCEAVLALVRAVKSAREDLVDDNITPYIVVRVKGAIKDFCAKDSLIPIPRAVFKEMQEIETITEFANRTDGNGIVVHSEGVLTNAPIIIPLGGEYRNVEIPCDDHSHETVDDLFVKMELTETEIRVCSDRLDGYTLSEIGTRMGISHVMVWKIIEGIKSKFPKLGLKNVNHTPINPGKKTCSACGCEKSLTFFYKIGNDSYKSECKQCLKEKRDATSSIH